jgi:hypothetical protein
MQHRVIGDVAGGANIVTQGDVLIQRTNPFLTPQILSILNPAGGTSLFNLNAAGTGPGIDDAGRGRGLPDICAVRN